MGRLEDIIGKKLARKDTPGYATGRIAAPCGIGILDKHAPSFVSTCMFAGQHTLLELIEPCNVLRCFFNEWGIIQDSVLLHM